MDSNIVRVPSTEAVDPETTGVTALNPVDASRIQSNKSSEHPGEVAVKVTTVVTHMVGPVKIKLNFEKDTYGNAAVLGNFKKK